jgi:hypothetical protein
MPGDRSKGNYCIPKSLIGISVPQHFVVNVLESGIAKGCARSPQETLNESKSFGAELRGAWQQFRQLLFYPLRNLNTESFYETFLTPTRLERTSPTKSASRYRWTPQAVWRMQLHAQDNVPCPSTSNVQPRRMWRMRIPRVFIAIQRSKAEWKSCKRIPWHGTVGEKSPLRSLTGSPVLT